jgi:hypothetical protein
MPDPTKAQSNAGDRDAMPMHPSNAKLKGYNEEKQKRNLQNVQG